jgi:hypothetical protein
VIWWLLFLTVAFIALTIALGYGLAMFCSHMMGNDQ